MPLYLAIAVPLAAMAGYGCLGWTRTTRWLAAIAAGSVLVGGLWSRGTTEVDTAFGGWLRADPLAAYLLIVVGAAAALAMAGWPQQLANEVKDHVLGPVTARWYGVFASGLLAATVIAATSSSTVAAFAAVGAVIVAIAGLVASRRKPAQKRAALVYGAACAGGLGLAVAGTILPQGNTATVVTVLGWSVLAGLAPLHWWLPPVVSVATAPVAVLIAGVQVPVAVTAILRLDRPPREVLIGLGLASLAVAVAGLARQRDLRRLIAHGGLAGVGLAALALGADAGQVGQWLLLCLGLNAAVLYLAAGHVVSLTGSGRMDTARGLLSRNNLLGQVLGLGLFTATVLAPASGFARMSIDAARPLGVLALGCVTALAAVALLTATYGWPMLTGDPADRPDMTSGPARPLGSAGPVLIIGAVAAILATIAPR